MRVVVLCLVMSLVAVLPGCGLSSEVKKDPLFQPQEDVYTAAMAGDLEATIDFMNKPGWDPLVANHDGILPLCAAAKGGNVEIIQLMVDEGADVNEADLTGKTPIQYAKEAGHNDVVQVLEELGATG